MYAVELASALTAATILADAAVTPTVSEMTYNGSSGTLNHTKLKPIYRVGQKTQTIFKSA